jgi:hypothetical protein
LPKTNNNIEVIKIGITTSKKVAAFLDKLIETELYGRSRAEVAEQLIKGAMKEFLLSGDLEKLNLKL